MSALATKLPEAMRIHAAGDVQAAQSLYTEMLREHPSHPEVLFLLGTSYYQQKDLLQARELLQKALKISPKISKFAYRLAEVEIADNQPLAAAECLIQLLGKLDNDTTAYSSILAIIDKFPIHQQLIRPLHAALKQQPNSLFLHALMAKMQLEINANGDAVPHFEKVLKIAPQQNGEFLQCYARALHRSGQFDKANRVVENGLKLFPQEKMLWLQRGNNYGAESNWKEQYASYVNCLRHHPGDAQTENSIALLQLQNSGFKEGFELYRSRFRMEGQAYFPFPIPEWKGESVKGKKLILWMEQGVGDIIMFASLMPWLLAQHPDRVLLLTHPDKLTPIFQRAFPDIAMAPLFMNHDDVTWQHYDMHIPLGELMRYGLAHFTPSEHAPYLKANAEKTSELRAKYLNTTGGKALVGIAWHTVNPTTGYLRNIPLEKFKPLFKLPNIQCVSLQYTHPNAMSSFDKKIIDRHVLIDDSFSPFEDTDSLLAQIAAMDRVITIQNATAHMAGSIGKDTRLLLSSASDWRWGVDGERNRWYRSVKVVRQEEPYRWEKTMQQVAKECEGL